MPELKKKINALVILAVLFNSITTTAKSQVPPLYLAIESGDVDVVKGLLDQGANVNQIYKPQKWLVYTPLIDAVIAAKQNGTAGTQIVKILVNKGADVNGGTGFNPSPPLYEAIATDNAEVVKILLDNGAKIDGKDNLGVSPLQNAAQKGQAGIVQVLLEKGADVNVKNKWGQSALFYGIYNLSITKILLAHGANVLVKDYKGKTALDQTSEAKGITSSQSNALKEVSQFLLRYQSEGNNSEGKAHKEAAYENLGVALIEAIKENNLKDVISAIEKGADVNFIFIGKSDFGFDHLEDCTPLSLAAHKDNLEILKSLLEKGADPKTIDRDGKTFIVEYRLSESYNGEDAYSPDVKKLLKEYAKKTASPLWQALEQGDDKMVEILLTGGEDANKKLEIPDLDEKNYMLINGQLQNLKTISPIICAMRFGRMETIKTLLAHGADISGDDTIQGGMYAFYTVPMGYANDSLRKEGQKLCTKNKEEPWNFDQTCYQEFLNNPKTKFRQDDINKKTKEILNVLRDWYIQKKGCLPATFIVWSEDAWYMDLKLLAKVCDPNAKIGTAGFRTDNLLVMVAMPTNDACTDLLIAKGADIDEAIKSCRAVMANVEKYNANNPVLKVYQDKIDFLESKKKK